ncbi:peptidase C13 family-domain-containing protein [Tricharina praecox]|uniref:peptidase C13 family-domain-containing protein n=1 Tax=Tricharina praecox TaxID=43433 RepID=UPI00221E42EA|nr:peptidase C13 family-domain-containing protein [Tricharina praecox]KAI5846796.1 peptidase C13 family-domain-containing protein [Tricharina praecox]
MKLRLPTTIFLTLLLQLCCTSAQHTSNWAVLVSTSRFWFNYRHLANVLSMYRTVKRLGIPDSQIILMLADDVACNPRNIFPASVFNNADRGLDLYGDNIEVDYRGYEVTVENFIRLLTDRVEPDTPRSKRLLTDERSNIFVYMTGHGGNEFLKFQDAEEISAFDIADAFEQMWEKKRYHQMLFMIDTCQANTMYSKFYSPNILATGSSKLDQSSYSHHADNDVGVAVIDRYTYYNLEFLETNVQNASSKHTMKDLFDSYDMYKIHSDPGVRTDLFNRALDEVLITDFFGNVQNVEVDGSGEEEKWQVDAAELAKLAANITVPGRRSAAEKVVEETRGPAVKKVKAFKVQEEKGWQQSVVGFAALGLCAAVWFGGMLMPK